MTSAQRAADVDLLLVALAHESMAKVLKSRGLTPKFADRLMAEARLLREQA